DDVDFGYRGTGSIGDRLWIDTNNNGVQDSGENGLNGVTVSLLNGSNVVLFTAITSGNGNYTFTNLAAGSYSVRVETSTLPAGLAPTYDLDGTGTPNIAAAPLTGGQNRTDVDFGYRGTGSIGDRVWIDNDGDGVQDLLETGINGVTVQLLDGGGNVIASAVTAGDGQYQFQNLVAGTYSVQIVTSSLPAGLTQTFDLDGLATPNKATIALAANQSNFNVDFGYRGTASVGDRVWNDTDGDGVQDAGELGINGVDVVLRDSSNNVVAVVTTSGDGNYLFSNLLVGSYSVSVDPLTVPAGYVQTYDLDGIGTPNKTTFSLTAGQAKRDVDFGYRAPSNTGQCVDEAINDPTVQGAGANHAFWLPGIGTDYQFTPNPGTFVQNSNGTATMNGTLRSLSNSNNAWTVSIGFTGRTSVTPAGSPKKELKSTAYSENGGPVNTATWIYYTGYNGTLTGLNNNAGAVINITRTGPAFQVGVGANGKNLNFGASGWYLWTVVSQPSSGGSLPSTGQGDINVDIVNCPPPTPAPGTGTIGYWKTHASAWPVTSIKIGNQTYTVSQAVTLLGTASTGDKSIDLAKQLIAAKLNVLVGNVSTCISATITSADNWLKTYPVGSNVRGSSSAWTQASPWHNMLDEYNNGLLCAPHRD
ncbi:MAG: SdrD B-like domain-containing protein, partial [Acidobacteriota bacterium]